MTCTTGMLQGERLLQFFSSAARTASGRRRGVLHRNVKYADCLFLHVLYFEILFADAIPNEINAIYMHRRKKKLFGKAKNRGIFHTAEFERGFLARA